MTMQEYCMCLFEIVKLNIILILLYSNGKLDPWSRGGFLESVSESVVAILIDEGAHHLDLRSSNPADPPSVIKAREQEKTIIRGWINKYTSKIVEHNTYHLMFENHLGKTLMPHLHCRRQTRTRIPVLYGNKE